MVHMKAPATRRQSYVVSTKPTRQDAISNNLMDVDVRKCLSFDYRIGSHIDLRLGKRTQLDNKSANMQDDSNMIDSKFNIQSTIKHY